jgi:hypothetical protein
MDIVWRENRSVSLGHGPKWLEITGANLSSNSAGSRIQLRGDNKFNSTSLGFFHDLRRKLEPEFHFIEILLEHELLIETGRYDTKSS